MENIYFHVNLNGECRKMNSKLINNDEIRQQPSNDQCNAYCIYQSCVFGFFLLLLFHMLFKFQMTFECKVNKRIKFKTRHFHLQCKPIFITFAHLYSSVCCLFFFLRFSMVFLMVSKFVGWFLLLLLLLPFYYSFN